MADLGIQRSDSYRIPWLETVDIFRFPEGDDFSEMGEFADYVDAIGKIYNKFPFKSFWNFDLELWSRNAPDAVDSDKATVVDYLPDVDGLQGAAGLFFCNRPNKKDVLQLRINTGAWAPTSIAFKVMPHEIGHYYACRTNMTRQEDALSRWAYQWFLDNAPRKAVDRDGNYSPGEDIAEVFYALFGYDERGQVFSDGVPYDYKDPDKMRVFMKVLCYLELVYSHCDVFDFSVKNGYIQFQYKYVVRNWGLWKEYKTVWRAVTESWKHFEWIDNKWQQI